MKNFKKLLFSYLYKNIGVGKKTLSTFIKNKNNFFNERKLIYYYNNKLCLEFINNADISDIAITVNLVAFYLDDMQGYTISVSNGTATFLTKDYGKTYFITGGNDIIQECMLNFFDKR